MRDNAVQHGVGTRTPCGVPAQCEIVRSNAVCARCVRSTAVSTHEGGATQGALAWLTPAAGVAPPS